MIHSGMEYPTITLLLVGIVTLVCMGMSVVLYIGLPYRNPYLESLFRSLCASNSRIFTTLRLCVSHSNRIYKKPTDPLLTMNRKKQKNGDNG